MDSADTEYKLKVGFALGAKMLSAAHTKCDTTCVCTDSILPVTPVCAVLDSLRSKGRNVWILSYTLVPKLWFLCLMSCTTCRLLQLIAIGTLLSAVKLVDCQVQVTNAEICTWLEDSLVQNLPLTPKVHTYQHADTPQLSLQQQ